MRDGKPPRRIIEMLKAADSGHASRQVHIMDAGGHVAAYTGAECIEWCGHIEGSGFSVADNMLAGAGVLNDTAAAYIAGAARPFARRLIAAMRAGEAAGGDKRGRQSAALLITAETNGLISIFASTITLIRWANSNASNRSAASAGCISARSCRPAPIPAGVTDRGIIEATLETAAAAPK